VNAVARRALRDQRRAPLIWGVSLGLLCALELAIYPSVHKSLGKALASYPDAIKQAFQIQSFNTPAEFVSAEMFSLVIPLAIGFYAIRAATRPVVGYEEHHWLDVVLTAPVRRRALVANAFAAAALSSLAILVTTGVLIWLAGQIFGAEIGFGDLVCAVVGTWCFALFFAGLALCAAGRLGSWTVVTEVAAGVLVVMYVVDVAARIQSSLDVVGHFSAFHYYDTPLIDGLSLGHAGLAVAGMLLAGAGALLFERRDVSG
jgi:ABC-type transport system involved in multi-copper enzyme maturation permease subunit